MAMTVEFDRMLEASEAHGGLNGVYQHARRLFNFSEALAETPRYRPTPAEEGAWLREAIPHVEMLLAAMVYRNDLHGAILTRRCLAVLLRRAKRLLEKQKHSLSGVKGV
ncbi:MAG TPA: hypothetical protein VM431_11785 [Phycisphaerae bacterium]|nr:hypothetical protein [Phycisphaerae bacterium]